MQLSAEINRERVVMRNKRDRLITAAARRDYTHAHCRATEPAAAGAVTAAESGPAVRARRLIN